MSSKEDYSSEEWELLVDAPMQAAVTIVLASPGGPFSASKEMWAALKKMVTVSQDPTATPLMRDLGVSFQDKDTVKATQPTKEDLRRPESYMRQALDHLKQVAVLLDEKASADEAAQVKSWLVEVAQKTAEAGKEGGFMGIGGVRVNEAEEAALNNIAAALGVSR